MGSSMGSGDRASTCACASAIMSPVWNEAKRSRMGERMGETENYRTFALDGGAARCGGDPEGNNQRNGEGQEAEKQKKERERRKDKDGARELLGDRRRTRRSFFREELRGS